MKHKALSRCTFDYSRFAHGLRKREKFNSISFQKSIRKGGGGGGGGNGHPPEMGERNQTGWEEEEEEMEESLEEAGRGRQRRRSAIGHQNALSSPTR